MRAPADFWSFEALISAAQRTVKQTGIGVWLSFAFAVIAISFTIILVVENFMSDSTPGGAFRRTIPRWILGADVVDALEKRRDPPKRVRPRRHWEPRSSEIDTDNLDNNSSTDEIVAAVADGSAAKAAASNSNLRRRVTIGVASSADGGAPADESGVPASARAGSNDTRRDTSNGGQPTKAKRIGICRRLARLMIMVIAPEHYQYIESLRKEGDADSDGEGGRKRRRRRQSSARTTVTGNVAGADDAGGASDGASSECGSEDSNDRVFSDLDEEDDYDSDELDAYYTGIDGVGLDQSRSLASYIDGDAEFTDPVPTSGVFPAYRPPDANAAASSTSDAGADAGGRRAIRGYLPGTVGLAALSQAGLGDSLGSKPIPFPHSPRTAASYAAVDATLRAVAARTLTVRLETALRCGGFIDRLQDAAEMVRNSLSDRFAALAEAKLTQRSATAAPGDGPQPQPSPQSKSPSVSATLSSLSTNPPRVFFYVQLAQPLMAIDLPFSPWCSPETAAAAERGILLADGTCVLTDEQKTNLAAADAKANSSGAATDAAAPVITPPLSHDQRGLLTAAALRQFLIQQLPEQVTADAPTQQGRSMWKRCTAGGYISPCITLRPGESSLRAAWTHLADREMELTGSRPPLPPSLRRSVQRAAAGRRRKAAAAAAAKGAKGSAASASAVDGEDGEFEYLSTTASGMLDPTSGTFRRQKSSQADASSKRGSGGKAADVDDLGEDDDDGDDDLSGFSMAIPLDLGTLANDGIITAGGAASGNGKGGAGGGTGNGGVSIKAHLVAEAAGSRDRAVIELSWQPNTSSQQNGANKRETSSADATASNSKATASSSSQSSAVTAARGATPLPIRDAAAMAILKANEKLRGNVNAQLLVTAASGINTKAMAMQGMKQVRHLEQMITSKQQQSTLAAGGHHDAAAAAAASNAADAGEPFSSSARHQSQIGGTVTGPSSTLQLSAPILPASHPLIQLQSLLAAVPLHTSSSSLDFIVEGTDDIRLGSGINSSGSSSSKHRDPRVAHLTALDGTELSQNEWCDLWGGIEREATDALLLPREKTLEHAHDAAARVLGHKKSGDSFMSSNDIPKALAHYSRAIACCPLGVDAQLAMLYALRATAFARAWCWAGVVSDVHTALSLGVAHAVLKRECHILLGKAWQMLACPQQALDSFDTALSLGASERDFDRGDDTARQALQSAVAMMRERLRALQGVRAASGASSGSNGGDGAAHDASSSLPPLASALTGAGPAPSLLWSQPVISTGATPASAANAKPSVKSVTGTNTSASGVVSTAVLSSGMPASSPIVGMQWHTSTVVKSTKGSARMFCFGGWSADGPSSALHVCDLSTKAWVTLLSLPTRPPGPLYCHTASLVLNRYIVFLGGSGCPQARSTMRMPWVLDTHTLAWGTVEAEPAAADEDGTAASRWWADPAAAATAAVGSAAKSESTAAAGGKGDDQAKARAGSTSTSDSDDGPRVADSTDSSSNGDASREPSPTAAGFASGGCAGIGGRGRYPPARLAHAAVVVGADTIYVHGGVGAGYAAGRVHLPASFADCAGRALGDTWSLHASMVQAAASSSSASVPSTTAGDADASATAQQQATRLRLVWRREATSNLHMSGAGGPGISQPLQAAAAIATGSMTIQQQRQFGEYGTSALPPQQPPPRYGHTLVVYDPKQSGPIGAALLAAAGVAGSNVGDGSDAGTGAEGSDNRSTSAAASPSPSASAADPSAATSTIPGASVTGRVHIFAKPHVHGGVTGAGVLGEPLLCSPGLKLIMAGGRDTPLGPAALPMGTGQRVKKAHAAAAAASAMPKAGAFGNTFDTGSYATGPGASDPASVPHEAPLALLDCLTDVKIYDCDSRTWLHPLVLGSAPRAAVWHTAVVLKHWMFCLGGLPSDVDTGIASMGQHGHNNAPAAPPPSSNGSSISAAAAPQQSPYSLSPPPMGVCILDLHTLHWTEPMLTSHALHGGLPAARYGHSIAPEPSSTALAVSNSKKKSGTAGSGGGGGGGAVSLPSQFFDRLFLHGGCALTVSYHQANDKNGSPAVTMTDSKPSDSVSAPRRGSASSASAAAAAAAAPSAAPISSTAQIQLVQTMHPTLTPPVFELDLTEMGGNSSAAQGSSKASGGAGGGPKGSAGAISSSVSAVSGAVTVRGSVPPGSSFYHDVYMSQQQAQQLISTIQQHVSSTGANGDAGYDDGADAAASSSVPPTLEEAMYGPGGVHGDGAGAAGTGGVIGSAGAPHNRAAIVAARLQALREKKAAIASQQQQSAAMGSSADPTLGAVPADQASGSNDNATSAGARVSGSSPSIDLSWVDALEAEEAAAREAQRAEKEKQRLKKERRKEKEKVKKVVHQQQQVQQAAAKLVAPSPLTAGALTPTSTSASQPSRSRAATDVSGNGISSTTATGTGMGPASSGATDSDVDERGNAVVGVDDDSESDEFMPVPIGRSSKHGHGSKHTGVQSQAASTPGAAAGIAAVGASKGKNKSNKGAAAGAASSSAHPLPQVPAALQPQPSTRSAVPLPAASAAAALVSPPVKPSGSVPAKGPFAATTAGAGTTPLESHALPASDMEPALPSAAMKITRSPPAASTAGGAGPHPVPLSAANASNGGAAGNSASNSGSGVSGGGGSGLLGFTIGGLSLADLLAPQYSQGQAVPAVNALATPTTTGATSRASSSPSVSQPAMTPASGLHGDSRGNARLSNAASEFTTDTAASGGAQPNSSSYSAGGAFNAADGANFEEEEEDDIDRLLRHALELGPMMDSFESAGANTPGGALPRQHAGARQDYPQPEQQPAAALGGFPGSSSQFGSHQQHQQQQQQQPHWMSLLDEFTTGQSTSRDHRAQQQQQQTPLDQLMQQQQQHRPAFGMPAQQLQQQAFASSRRGQPLPFQSEAGPGAGYQQQHHSQAGGGSISSLLGPSSLTAGLSSILRFGGDGHQQQSSPNQSQHQGLAPYPQQQQQQAQQQQPGISGLFARLTGSSSSSRLPPGFESQQHLMQAQQQLSSSSNSYPHGTSVGGGGSNHRNSLQSASMFGVDALAGLDVSLDPLAAAWEGPQGQQQPAHSQQQQSSQGYDSRQSSQAAAASTQSLEALISGLPTYLEQQMHGQHHPQSMQAPAGYYQQQQQAPQQHFHPQTGYPHAGGLQQQQQQYGIGNSMGGRGVSSRALAMAMGQPPMPPQQGMMPQYQQQHPGAPASAYRGGAPVQQQPTHFAQGPSTGAPSQSGSSGFRARQRR